MTDQPPKIEKRPRFGSVLLQELREDYDERGVLAIIPVWLIGCVGLSLWTAWLLPAEFFTDSKWDISTAVYAGLLTFNGLLLALSWQAFSRIQASICAPGFSSFLKRKSLMSGYLFWIDYVQYSQVAAVCASGIGLLSILLDRLLLFTDRIIIGLAVGLSIYAIKNALDAMHLMHDVVWLHAEFDEIERLKKIDTGNVTRLSTGGRQEA